MEYILATKFSDMLSYGSNLHLHVSHPGNKLVFFVDNEPWMDNTRHSKPLELWQLMVTQLRNSPFANRRKDFNSEKKVFARRVSQMLHGCVTFEIEWSNVRGIQYINELQTDTSVAFEVKIMVKRDFSNFNEALNFYVVSSIKGLASTLPEQNFPRCDAMSSTDICGMNGGYFSADLICVLLDASSYPTSHCKNNSFAPIIEQDLSAEPKLSVESTMPNSLHGSDSCGQYDCSSRRENEYDSLIIYKDMLLLFRFKDPMLPLELKKIIISDQTLLKMLESGLPSWIIIMQSYPFVSKLYRSWMRPLVRTTYVVVSIVTAIIGLYDLYKNLPVFKATAARLCGLLFEWIEDSEMVSRIQYLGTIFCLQKFERAFQPLLSVITILKRMFAIMLKPMMEPLEEFAELIWWLVWSILFYSAWESASVIYLTIAPGFKYTVETFQVLIWPIIILMASIWKFCTDLVQLISWPFMVCVMAIWKLVTMLLYLIIYVVWSFVMSPFRLTRLLYEFIAAIILNVCKLAQNLWTLSTSLSYVTVPQGVKTAKASASMWRILWNNIFFRVFRAVRNILNVFVTFFCSCNRHRFSIYNNIKTLIHHLECMEKCMHVRVKKLHHILLLGNQGASEDDECKYGGGSSKSKLKSSESGYMPRVFSIQA